MKTNEILDEIHRIRQQHAQRLGGNLKAIFDDMRAKQQRLSNVVDIAARPPRPSLAAEQRATYGAGTSTNR